MKKDYMKLGSNLLDTSVPDSLSYSYNEDPTRAEASYLPQAQQKAQL